MWCSVITICLSLSVPQLMMSNSVLMAWSCFCGSGVSGQASDVDSCQQPHSTEKESGQTRKYVTSQLQSLLQQHLQRNTALRSIQQQQQQRAALSVGNPSDNLSTTTAIPQLMPSIVPIMAMPPSLIPMPQPHTQQVRWSGLASQFTGLRPCQSVHRSEALPVSSQAWGRVSQYTGLRPCQSVHRPEALSVSSQAWGLVSQFTGLRPCQSVHRSDPHATAPHPAGTLAWGFASQYTGLRPCQSVHRPEALLVSTQVWGLASQFTGLRPCQSVNRPEALSVSSQVWSPCHSPTPSRYVGLRLCQSVHRPEALPVSTQAWGLASQYTGLRPCQSVHRPEALSVS